MSGSSRGVVISFEVLVLLGAIMAIAAFLGIALIHYFNAQASSAKTTIVVPRGEGWYFSNDAYISDNNDIIVSFEVENLGDAPASITHIIVYPTNDTDCYYYASVGKTVNPGETITVSVKASINDPTGCSTYQIARYSDLVVYYESNGRGGSVEIPIPMGTP